MGISQGMLLNLLAVVVIHLNCFTESQNEWRSDSSSWWQSTSDFSPTHSKAFGTLQLRDALYMHFDIIFHGPTPSVWQNVFRIGFQSSNGDCAHHNSRYPSLWMLPNVNKWHFSVSETANCGKQWGYQPAAIIGLQYRVIIHYNQAHILISLNDIIYVNTTRTSTMAELIGNAMNVYISTDEPGYSIPAANVTMSNIVIVSYWNNQSFTFPPTLSPTNPPSIHPTKHPSNSPTSPSINPTTYPTNEPTKYPTINPTADPTTVPSVQPTTYTSYNPTIFTSTSDYAHNAVTKQMQAIDPVITIMVENLIYIGIALLACLAISCPAVIFWICCYAKTMGTRSEQNKDKDSDKELAEEIQSSVRHKLSFSGSPYTIPIQRINNNVQHSLKKGTHDSNEEDVVPTENGMDNEFKLFNEGSGDMDMDTDNDNDMDSNHESEHNNRLAIQRKKDAKIMQEQRRVHNERFLTNKMLEMYKVDTTSDLEQYQKEDDDTSEEYDPGNEYEFVLQQQNIIITDSEKKVDDVVAAKKKKEGVMPGMGVNKMNLEEALDDGLSIVPSIGRYANSELSGKESTLSATYKLRDVDKYLSALPQKSHVQFDSGSSTIDEEKSETFDHNPVHIMRYNMQKQTDIEIEDDNEEEEEDDDDTSEESRKGRMTKKINRNGNPFIPKRELATDYIDEDNEYEEYEEYGNGADYNGNYDNEYSNEFYENEYFDEEEQKQHDLHYNRQKQTMNNNQLRLAKHRNAKKSISYDKKRKKQR